MELIQSENPRTVDQIFNLWWLDRIDGRTTNPSTPEQSFSIAFVFVRGFKTGDVWTLSDDFRDRRTLDIADAFLFAAEQAQLGNMQPAELLGGIISVSSSIAKQQQVID